MPGPLEGIRVFDLTVWMVGPWASMQLGAMGADVIHIEQPGVPLSELGAGVPPTINGTSVGYITWNMNKRCLTLDLKTEEGRQTAYELLKTSDVMLINMRPGVANRLGVDYETVSRINPRLVYCSLTGWGDTGPMARRPGADGQMQGFSGFWSVNGERDREGEFYRHFTQLDANTGNYAVQAVLMALLGRNRTGQGQYIELPMIKAAISLQTPLIFDYLQTGVIPKPLGSRGRYSAPDEAYLCEDGQYIGVSVHSDDEWVRLCQAIGRPEWADDDRFHDNVSRLHHVEELTAALEPVFRSKPLHHWMTVLTRAGVACGYPLRFHHLQHHRQVLDNGYLVEIETEAWGRLTTGGPPWQFSRTPARWTRTPYPGEHNEEILGELMTGGAS